MAEDHQPNPEPTPESSGAAASAGPNPPTGGPAAAASHPFGGMSAPYFLPPPPMPPPPGPMSPRLRRKLEREYEAAASVYQQTYGVHPSQVPPMPFGMAPYMPSTPVPESAPEPLLKPGEEAGPPVTEVSASGCEEPPEPSEAAPAPRGTVGTREMEAVVRQRLNLSEEELRETFDETPKSPFVLVVLPLLGVVLLVLLVIGAVMWFSSQAGDSANFDGPVESRSVSAVLSADAAIAAGDINRANFPRFFLQRNGGEGSIRDLNTLSLRGTVESEEGTFPFASHKREPQQSMIRLDLGRFSVTTVSDDEEAWRYLTARDSETAVRVIKLEGVERQVAINDAHFFDALVRHCLDGEGRLLGVEAEVAASGDEVLVVTWQPEDADGSTIRFTVDAQEARLLRAATVLADGTAITREYSDYRRVDGFWMPHRIANFRNDEAESVVTVEQMQFNVGLMNIIFEPPEVAQGAPGEAAPPGASPGEAMVSPL